MIIDNALLEKMDKWIVDYFNGSNGYTAVLGMSGGKDSTVSAKSLTRSLGPDRVVGVFMPNGIQSDIDDAHAAAEAAGLTRTITVNIRDAYSAIASQIPGFYESDQAKTNLAPRLRMATLYAVAQTVDRGRVCCTGNLSEAMVGYCTLYGDLAGDFALLSGFKKEEVCELGKLLGLPENLVNKTPSDGLSGKTDEEKMGFTYDDISRYIDAMVDRTTDMDALRADPVMSKIHKMVQASKFKRDMLTIPCFLG